VHLGQRSKGLPSAPVVTIEELPSPTRDRDLPAANARGRSNSSRPLIVGASAAALVGVGILIGWTIGPPGSWGPSASAFAQTTPSSTATSTPHASGLGVNLILGTGGIRFALSVGAGWEHFGPDYPNYITKSVLRGQGAEALIYWTDLPNGSLTGGCHYLRNQRTGPSVEDVAAVVAAAPGTDLISAPSQVTLGGHPAQHVALTVREDVGCDPGFFFTYPMVYGGALWPETVPGDTIRVWIIDVDGDLLFIAGATKAEAGVALEQDLADVVQSIQFE